MKNLIRGHIYQLKKDNFLSRLLCSCRSGTHSFCNGAYQLCTYNDDLYPECNYRRCFRSCDSEYAENFRNGFGIFENSY